SFQTHATNTGIGYDTLLKVFDALEKTEILLRVYPYGSHSKQTTNSSKFLFMSSAYRSMYFNLVGSVFGFNEYKGKLVEDIVGLYLHRMFSQSSSVLRGFTHHDISGGADFIINCQDANIAMEVGYGKKDFKQVEKSSNEVNTKYNLVI